MNQTPSVPQSTARETTCAYCGASDEPMRNKDLRSDSTGYAWRLASACIDARSCTQRAAERDAHMDERFSLTEAGRGVALAFIEQAEQTRLPVAS